ncbi:MAG: hypothetical protein ACLU45_01655 [Dialister invisus]|uniref:hypothetical protein n=1 Tax=Dialister invisus TaxID=218538 RepID=UPI00399B8676
MKIKGYEYPAALGGTGYSLFKLNEEVWNEVTIITPPNWELAENNKDGLPMLVNQKTGDNGDEHFRNRRNPVYNRNPVWENI